MLCEARSLYVPTDKWTETVLSLYDLSPFHFIDASMYFGNFKVIFLLSVCEISSNSGLRT